MKKYSGHIDIYTEGNIYTAEVVEVSSLGKKGEWVNYTLPRSVFSLLKPTGDTISSLREERESLKRRFSTLRDEINGEDFRHVNGRLQAFMTEQAEGMRIYGIALTKRIELLEKGIFLLPNIEKEWQIIPTPQEED